MPDWRTRLAVSYHDDSGSHDITPIDSFSPSFSLAAEALHSLEKTHIGAIYSPKAITFSLTVKAIGDVAAQLTALAMQGTKFDITLQETNDGHDWSFSSIVLNNCIITNAAPTSATISGAPAATFSGFSLAATETPKTGSSVSIP